MSSSSATANIKKVSSQSKLSSTELSAQEAVEYHQDHRRRSLSTERMSKTESTAMKSLSSHTENVSEESRVSSARFHEGKVMSSQIENGLSSANRLVAGSSTINASAIAAQSSSESHKK